MLHDGPRLAQPDATDHMHSRPATEIDFTKNRLKAVPDLTLITFDQLGQASSTQRFPILLCPPLVSHALLITLLTDCHARTQADQREAL